MKYKYVFRRSDGKYYKGLGLWSNFLTQAHVFTSSENDHASTCCMGASVQIPVGPASAAAQCGQSIYAMQVREVKKIELVETHWQANGHSE